MKNNQQIPVLKQSTIEQHEVKNKPVNYTAMREKKEKSYKQESNITAVKKNLIEQDLNLVSDAIQIAQRTLDRIVQDDGVYMDLKCRVELTEKAAKYRELYNRLNQ